MPPKFAGLETKAHPNLLTSIRVHTYGYHRFIIIQYEDSVAGICKKSSDTLIVYMMQYSVSTIIN